LLAGAEALVPALRDAARVETRVGLRPVTPDKLPLIGPAPGYANLILATGHGRNGILMTPITADLTAEYALRRIAPPALVAPDRFGGRAV
jgi:glycine/D-amino acid oxidase-like deaminating enzyme